jgi:hypothetical protein
MLAVIYDRIENAFQDILKENIQKKYPSISFEVLDRASIVSEPPPETIILVMNEEVLNDVYIKIVKTSYPKLEHFICLVSPEKYEEYYSRYSPYCKILKQNKKDIRMWFESIEGEPKSLKQTKELTDDIDLDDLSFESDEDSGSEPKLENKMERLLDLDIPDIVDLTTDDQEKQENGETSDETEQGIFQSDNSTEKEESNPEYENKNISLPIEGYEETDDSASSEEKDLSDDEEVEGEKVEGEEKEDEKAISPEDKKFSLEEIKKQELQKQKYERKIIALREELNIPVWKKRQIPFKTIGIWSPLHRIGVTTLTVNLALYLASLSIPVAVLEGITKNLKMKSLLEIYSGQKRRWISYNSFLEEEHHAAKDMIWTYRNVNFFPFEEHDLVSKWNEQKVYYFINGLKFHDLVLIDFPTGEMAPYTIESLQYVDELWIVMNNDLLSMMEWKEYIHQHVKPKVSIYGFFLDAYPFNKPKKIADQLDIRLISSFPALHEEVARNYYESIPLIEHEGVLEKIENGLIAVLEHLTGEKVKKSVQQEKDDGVWNRFAKKLKWK